jgi:hypothetical protein
MQRDGEPDIEAFLNGACAMKVAIGIAALLIFAEASIAQIATPPNGSMSIPKPPITIKDGTVSLTHLYWHFLSYQSHLDRKAVSREQQGKDSGWLRHHFQHGLGFTDSEFAHVRDAASQLDSEIKQMNTQAKVLVQADRDSRLAGLISPGAISPNRARLIALDQQREATIEGIVGSLKSSLGPQRAATLDTFLQQTFAQKVTAQHLETHDPGKYFIKPLQGEVRP